MWLEFAEDGSVVRANGRIVDGEWQLKGETLTLKSSVREGALRGELSQPVAIKISGDQITRKAEAAVMEVASEETSSGRRRVQSNPDTSRMNPQPPIAWLDEHTIQRVTPAQANQPALVGIWGYKNKAGRPVLERYTPSRHFAVLEPLAAQRGTFKVAGNKLAVTADGATTEVPIVCGRDAFELDVNGSKLRFQKFQ